MCGTCVAHVTCVALVWHRCGTSVAQVWHRCGTGVAQVWRRWGRWLKSSLWERFDILYMDTFIEV